MRNLSEKFKDGVSSLKDKFDPSNMGKVFGGGDFGASIFGRILGKNKDGMKTLGKKKGKAEEVKTSPASGRKVGNIDTAFYTTVAEGQKGKLRKNDGVADVAAKLTNFLIKSQEDKKLQSELSRNFELEQHEEDRRRHKQFVDALVNTQKQAEDIKLKKPKKTGKAAAKTKKAPKEEVKPTAKKAEAPSAPAPAPSAAKAVTSTGEKVAIGVTIGAAAAGTAVVTKGLLMPSETVATSIDKASKETGVDKALMYAMAKQESGFNPAAAAGTSSAKGLYQFINKSWEGMVKKYGSKYPILRERGPTDPDANALAGALFIRDNSDYLKSAGIPVNATTIYAAHFLGPAGAKKLLTADPNANAAQLMPEPAAANKNIFYDKQNNPKTVQQVVDVLFQKVGQYQQKYAERLNTPNDTGSKLNDSSTENKDLKENSKGSTVGVNNSKTVINTASNQKPQVISQTPSLDYPTFMSIT